MVLVTLITCYITYYIRWLIGLKIEHRILRQTWRYARTRAQICSPNRTKMYSVIHSGSARAKCQNAKNAKFCDIVKPSYINWCTAIIPSYIVLHDLYSWTENCSGFKEIYFLLRYTAILDSQNRVWFQSFFAHFQSTFSNLARSAELMKFIL